MAIRKLYEPEKNDNYTDKTFIDKVDKMAAMKTPGHFSYIILAYKFDKVVQQISSVFATILLFDFVSKNRKILAFGHYKILATEFAAMASFYFFFVHFWNIPKLQTSHFVEMFVFHLLLAIFTPILKNLTFYYSDSAIWSLVSFCFVTNVVFHEYAKFARIDGPEGLLSVPLTLSEATSLNAAISGCVILSSRLDSNSDVIFFLTLAFQIFVFSPIFFRILRKKSKTTELVVTAVISLALIKFLHLRKLEKILFFYISILFVVFVICPIIFFHLNKQKEVFEDDRFPVLLN